MKTSAMIRVLCVAAFLFFSANSLVIAQIYYNSSNNVGIGTTSPSQKLDVSGGSININQDQAYRANGNWLIGQASGTNAIHIGVANDILFNSHLSTGIVAIKYNGSVGIGTTSPNAHLDVVGIIRSRYLSPDETKSIWITPSTIRFYGSNNTERFSMTALLGPTPSGNDQLCFSSYSGYLLVTFTGNGYVGLGVAYPGYKLHVAGDACAYHWYTSSDSKLKKDINTIDGALDKVSALRGVEFKWRTDEFPDRRFDKGKKAGLIAEEVEKVLPEAVSTDNEGYKAIEYAGVVGVLVEAVKELKTQCGELKTQCGELKKENEELRARIDVLEKDHNPI